MIRKVTFLTRGIVTRAAQRLPDAARGALWRDMGVMASGGGIRAKPSEARGEAEAAETTRALASA